MKNLQHFLQRLSDTLNRDSHLKSSVINIIKERTSLELPEASVELKNGELRIDASPGVKSEIGLKEGLILGDIKQRLSLKIERIFYQ